MSRRDCLAWLRRHDYPEPPKSACIGCPFHDNARWRYLRDHDTDAWGEVYLHRSCIPLDEADLSMVADYGHLDLWPNECEGMCGV